MSSENALVIFVRNPIPGTGKTRLAASVGIDKAHQVYLHLLAHTRKVAESVPVNRHLFYAGEIDNNDAWHNDYFDKQLQANGDLGYKMKLAFSTVLQRSTKAVIIGSDCPSLDSKHINKAFTALDTADVVIGPSEDGGYYLLGMKKVLNVVFDNKSWSTDKLMDETVASLVEEGLSYTLLDTLNDIDTVEDLRESNLAHLI